YWKLSGAFTRLRIRLAEFGLEPSGVPFGLFYDDPTRVPSAETRYSICYPIAGSELITARRTLGTAEVFRHAEAEAGVSPPEDLISLMYFPATTAVTVEYEGPAADSPQVYEHLRSWIERTTSVPQGPPRELYRAEPGSLSGGLMHVEVQQPLAPSRLTGNDDPEDKISEGATAPQ
ncbi:MAG: GyrI-like domain-containing protein, partial [Thioalkalivibrio sp.]|nr:GyrI-like domain-containing protein [Thioalkalivibrio sp.]